MKLLNLNEEERTNTKKYFNQIIKEELEKLLEININKEPELLLEKMDEIRNSIMLFSFLDEFAVEKEILLNNVNKNIKKD